MRLAIFVLQLLITLVIVALTAPMVLAKLPAARATPAGPALIVGAIVVVFVVLRLAWPGARR